MNSADARSRGRHCARFYRNREPQPEVDPVPVQMELRRIIISEVDEHQVIVLKEVDGERSFPM